MRTLARRYVTFNDYLHLPTLGWCLGRVGERTHRLDGAIQLDNGSHGMIFIMEALEAAGLPVLRFPTDAVDSRTWDNRQLTAFVPQFIEERLEGSSTCTTPSR